MPSWLKPETLLTAFISMAGMGGTVLLNWNSGNVHSALNDRDMTSLKDDVKAIRDSIAPVPQLAFKILQLEAWRDEQKTQNGEYNARLHTVEDRSNESKTKVDAIFAASGLTPDGRKMR
jgi:hypothetical protein